RIAEQIAAQTLTAIIVVSGRFHRQISTPQLGIDRDRRPYAGVAGIRVGVVLPGFRAEFSILGDRVERPFLFAATSIDRPYVSGRVPHRIGRETLLEPGRNDDTLAIDHGPRAVADAPDMAEVDMQLLHEIDCATRTKRFHRHAGL